MPYVTNPTTGAQTWEGTVLPSATQDTVRATLANHESRIDTIEASDISGVTVDNAILRGNGTSGVQSSGWTIDDDGQASATVDGANEIGLSVTASGAGAIGILGYANGATSYGINGTATVSGSVGIFAYQNHASATAFQIRNSTGDTASFSFSGTGDKSIAFPDAGGTVAIITSAPATSASAGKVGSIAYDATHIYVCIAEGSWVRAILAAW